MQLPTHYMVTHQTDDPAGFLNTLKHSLDAGTRLLQLPARGMEAAVYRALAAKAFASALSIPLYAWEASMLKIKPTRYRRADKA